MASIPRAAILLLLLFTAHSIPYGIFGINFA